MIKPEKSPETSRFEPEAKVRVKRCVSDPDFPDIPLGGWSGIVKEIEQTKGEPTYFIEWDQRTLKGIHPVYRKRCERDGLEFETMWLAEDDIEPATVKPVAIEKPKAIVTKPLSETDQDDRVRMALGLTHDDALPEVSRKTLMAYYRYLKTHLKFPFKARYESDGTALTIHGLPEPKEYDLDEEEGLLCEARGREGPLDVPLSEVDDAVGNRKLVRDYGYWFWNWR